VPSLLDIDGDGEADALTDGVLVARWMFGFRGPVLVDDALSIACTRCTAAEIEMRLEEIEDDLDIDDDEETDPLTDGVLVVRWLFGFGGEQLISSAVDETHCMRCTATDIEAYLAGL
jgi:hypothetical protein